MNHGPVHIHACLVPITSLLGAQSVGDRQYRKQEKGMQTSRMHFVQHQVMLSCVVIYQKIFVLIESEPRDVQAARTLRL